MPDRALIIGAGVSGLTTALAFVRAGWQVTLLADSFAPHLTSNVAGALWEWPPAVCGTPDDEQALRRSRRWATTSYERFSTMAANGRTGVYLRPAVFYFRQSLSMLPFERAKMEDASSHVRGFRHDPALIAEAGVSSAAGICDAYHYLAPMIDTDAYLVWLREELESAGGVIQHSLIERPLPECAEALLAGLDGTLLINCAGLGAAALAPDEMYPVRGVLIRVRNDGRSMPQITTAHVVAPLHSDPGGEIIFIVPRGEDSLVLGGLAEPDQNGLVLDLQTYAPLRAMLARCIAFLPSLCDMEIDETEPVRIGLRPFRRGNIRVEHEAGTRVIHNYGHGGAGVTLSWGCAEDVVRIAAELRNGS